MSRYILVFATIVVLSVVAPKLYRMAFEKPVKKPFIQYSCIRHDFMIYRSNEKTWTDTRGNQYTRDEYEQQLPMLFFKQLLSSGTMPDTINGVAIDIPSVSREKSFFRLKPAEIDAPAPALYPLYESQSGRAMFDWPDDFFRITWRIEFIDASTNKILEEKSQMFSAALYHYGFIFPAKIISGIATSRKSCDEGYLIVDSKDQLFHLKMAKGKPFIKKITIPENLRFRHISCVDFRNKAFYAYLFSDNNEIYTLTQADYQLVKWPVDGYDPTDCELKIYGDRFNYTVVMEANDHVNVIVLDRQYKRVDSYTGKWPVWTDLKSGKIFGFLFPAELSMTRANSKFIRFYLNPSGGFKWIWLSLLLVAVQLIGLIRRKVDLKDHLADLGIIAVSGVFGFVAIHCFPNKFAGQE